MTNAHVPRQPSQFTSTENISLMFRVSLCAVAFLTLAEWSRHVMRLDGLFSLSFLASGVVVGACLRERRSRDFLLLATALSGCALAWDLLFRGGSVISACTVALTVATQAFAARLVGAAIERREEHASVWLNPAKIIIPAAIIGALAAGAVATAWPFLSNHGTWGVPVVIRILLARTLSDLSGALIVAPVVLGAMGFIPFLGERQRVRNVVTAALTVLGAAAVFWIVPPDSGSALALICLPIPLVVIASYRCSLPVLGLALGLMATMILGLTKAGYGPILPLLSSTPSQVMGSQAYLTILSLTGLLLGGVVNHARATSRQLALSEARYREFISRASEGVWRTDICPPVSTCLPPGVLARVSLERSIYSECNDAMARMYGLEKAKDLIGLPVTRLMSLDDPKNIDAIRTWIESGFSARETETREHDVNGQTRYFINSIVGTVTDGFLTHAWGVQRDVTHSRMTEEALERGRRRLQTIISNTPHVAVQGYDENGRVLFWNNASERMFGFSEQGALGRRPGELFLCEENFAEFLRVAQEVLRTGTARGPHERPFRRRDGTFGYALSTIFTVPGSQTPEVVCMDIDVTPRVEAERERARLEEHIRHSQRLESLGLLAGGLAHDFNNALVGILGNTDEALNTLPHDDPARPWIAEAHAAATRLAGIARGLLSGTGRDLAITRAVTVRELLERAAPTLRGSLPDGVTVRIEHGDACDFSIQADEPQIERALCQLVFNAAEASTHRPAEVVVRSGVSLPSAKKVGGPSPGAWVFIEVVDAGTGIDPTHIDHVFDPFFTTKFAGRGMGLAVVRGVMKSHGGTVSIDSQPERGTIMRLSFPLERDEVADSEQDSGNENHPAPEHSSMEEDTRTILIVDDEPMVRDVTSRLLMHRGWKTHVANSGEAALTMLQDDPGRYCVIIMDMTMPGMDGLQTLREVRKRYGDIPVLLCSGYPPESIAATCRDIGRVHYVQKPFDSKTLMNTIETAMTDDAAA
jgi:two-component system cell cycle sensor histidine kinase/response regulator CckA